MNTSKDSYTAFKQRLKEITGLQNLINTCKAAETIIKLGGMEGFKIVEYFELDTTSIESIHRSILKKETELDMLLASDKKVDNDQKVNYNAFLGAINMQLPFQINTRKTSLADFVGIYLGLMEKQRTEKKIYEKNKNKR